METLTSDEVFAGVGLIFVLAVGSQAFAAWARVPALIVLLGVGFVAGAVTDLVHPDLLLGAAFQPLVSLAVAIILYEAGLGLDIRRLVRRHRWVVARLVVLGVPITWAIGALAATLLLGMSLPAALMLGAILVVSGPTVVAPLLALVRPSERVQRILTWEGSVIDPVGAILGALVFHAIAAGAGEGYEVGEFLGSLVIGAAGAVVGVAVLWMLLVGLGLRGTLGANAQVGVVVGVAAACDVVQDDTGLIAAILIGLAVGNLDAFSIPVRRPSLETIVQLVLGLLFVSISATVTPASLRGVLLPSLALAAVLVLVARPVVAAISTVRAHLARGERAFIGWMAPRGIVAAATASTFGASLAAQGIDGAERILPATFTVIATTVTVYGLTARPVSRRLGVTRSPTSRPLIVGEDAWSVALGEAVRGAGLDVLMWASTVAQRRRIEAAGLALAAPEVVTRAAERGVPLEGVDALLLTGENDVIAVLSTALADTVDGPVHRFDRQGASTVTVHTLETDGHVPDMASRLLLVVRADGQLLAPTAADQPTLGAGDTVVIAS